MPRARFKMWDRRAPHSMQVSSQAAEAAYEATWQLFADATQATKLTADPPPLATRRMS